MKSKVVKTRPVLSAFPESTVRGRSEVTKWLARFVSPKVLIVGDLMLDEYVIGDCDRISPEAPVPLVRVQRRETVLGGAGNVVANVAALGGRPEIVAAVGSTGGQPDAIVRERLTDIGIPTIGLVPLADRSTTRKTRLVAGIHHVARFDDEISAPISESKGSEVVRLATSRIPQVDIVVLSDYRKGILTPKVIAEIIRSAVDQGVPVIIDPKGEDFCRYRGATLVTPNASEARIATAAPPDSDDWDWITNRLLHLTEVEAVAVTCGAAGIVLRGRYDSKHYHCRTVARPVFDVTGAGDTVVAAFAVTLGSGLDLVTAADIANLAAGVVVTKQGTSTVSQEELADVAAFKEGGKVMNLAQAVAHADRVRQNGGRVVFTNGCFDLLHAGHVHLIERARDHGDFLIVGLNSDESVRRIKGADRPIQSFHIRSRILAGMAAVDAVVPFSDDTPVELVRQLTPDAIVKGGDYEIDDVEGQEYAREVIIVPLIEGLSTSRILSAVRGNQLRDSIQ